MFSGFSKANKTFHKFSGEDINIIQKLDNAKLNLRFNVIGFSVMAICLLCLVSASIFIFNVLDGMDKLWSLPIGIFWGFTVTMIYVLLLYTITPPLLVDRSMLKKGKKDSKQSQSILLLNLRKLGDWFSVSMILRVGFILIFALIIAQPLNYILFKKHIKDDIELYKMNYKSDLIYLSDSASIVDEKKLYDEFQTDISLQHLNKNDSLNLAEQTIDADQKNLDDQKFLLESAELKNKINLLSIRITPKAVDLKSQLIENRYSLTEQQIESDGLYLNKNLTTNFDNTLLQQAFSSYINGMQTLIKNKQESNQEIGRLIDENKFYLRSIIFLNKKSFAVFAVNVFFILLFIVPIILKIQIRRLQISNSPGFYSFKEKYEVDFVSTRYKAFKFRFENKIANNYRNYHQRALTNLDKSLQVLEKINPEKATTLKTEIYNRFQYKAELYEKYLDPPFNLKDKTFHRITLSEDHFLEGLEDKNV